MSINVKHYCRELVVGVSNIAISHIINYEAGKNFV